MLPRGAAITERFQAVVCQVTKGRSLCLPEGTAYAKVWSARRALLVQGIERGPM